MYFNSYSYFLFLPIVYLSFYFSTDKYRWLVLLIASYGFYSSFNSALLPFILAFITIVSYFCGIILGKTTHKHLVFWSGTVACLLIMSLMKYLPFFLTYFKADSTDVNLLVSIGVSFITFQAISYLVDIYLENQEPERHFGYHALSLAFFPKLLQGPIERCSDLMPQLKKSYNFDYATMRSGILLFSLGLFKKDVVANLFSLYVNMVYNDVHHYKGLTLIIATYAYAFQIFFDFSGYTDMARGTARMFGINLTENFNNPYAATSIADFWRRWHISFSRWILDYIFKPLQMYWRNFGSSGTAMALIVTFLASGIWHGANCGFIIWGLLHGLYLAVSTYYRPYQKKLHNWLGFKKNNLLRTWQIFVTFNLVSFSWIFFRAGSVSDAWYVVTNLLNISWQELTDISFQINKSSKIAIFLIVAIITSILILSPKISGRINSLLVGKKRWLFYYVFIMFILLFRRYGEGAFIYGRF